MWTSLPSMWKIVIRSDAQLIPSKCSCCWPLVWRAWCSEPTLIKFLKVCRDLVMYFMFVHCSLDTKQKSYLTNQFCIRSIFLNSNLLFAHAHLSGISKNEKDCYNADVKHQERWFGVKFDNGNKWYRQCTKWFSGCSISKKISCRQTIKKDLLSPALKFFWWNNNHNSLPATLTTICVNYLPKHDVCIARAWNESRNKNEIKELQVWSFHVSRAVMVQNSFFQCVKSAWVEMMIQTAP